MIIVAGWKRGLTHCCEFVKNWQEDCFSNVWFFYIIFIQYTIVYLNVCFCNNYYIKRPIKINIWLQNFSGEPLPLHYKIVCQSSLLGLVDCWNCESTRLEIQYWILTYSIPWKGQLVPSTPNINLGL
jgi:hypothetical protein